MHRLILGLTDPKIFTDHKDHNGLNNQRENLRKSTNQQNQFNQLPRGGTSIYRGVIKRKNRKGVWISNISISGKSIFVGYFKSEKKAALAYNKKAIELHGEFAYLNKL